MSHQREIHTTTATYKEKEKCVCTHYIRKLNIYFISICIFEYNEIPGVD